MKERLSTKDSIAAWVIAIPMFCFAGGPVLSAQPQIPELNWKERSDWINVKTDVNPKAVGNGTADDTAALQAAFSSVDNGTTVYLPPGTYRITNTLTITGPRIGVLVIGHGRTTKIVWDGPAGGRMYWSNGVAYSRYVGLTWDGRGKAAVGIDHQGDNRFETEVRHQHQAFLNFTHSGLSVGRNQKKASAEIEILNCLFENCAYGASFWAFNDYDNTFDGCEFRNCGIGISDSHGNFYARNCHFEGSKRMDFSIASEHGSSVRRCTSVGSQLFILHRNGVVPITVQDCHVSGWKDPGGAIKLQGGPAIIFDCVFTKPPSTNPPIRVNSGGQRLVHSNNISADTNGVVSSGSSHITNIPAGKRKGVVCKGAVRSARQSFLKEEVRIPGKVFDAKRDFGAKGNGSTDDTAAIQAAIDAARRYRRNAIAYLPTGRYKITKTIQIAGGNYFVGGSGFRTGLLWGGPANGVMVSVHDPQDVTLEQINVGSHDVGRMNNGIDIKHTGSRASSMFYDGVYVFGMYQKDALRKGLHFVNLPKGTVVHGGHVQGNLQFKNSSRAKILINTSYEGSITVEGTETTRDGFLGFMTRLATGIEYGLHVKDNQDIVLSDFYIEQAERMYCLLEGNAELPKGRVTLQGAKTHLRQNPVVEVRDYKGTFSFGHHQLYGEPKPHAVFSHKGTNPFNLIFMGVIAYAGPTPVFQLDKSATLILIENQNRGGQRIDNIIPEGALKEAAFALDHLRRLGEIDLELNHPSAKRKKTPKTESRPSKTRRKKRAAATPTDDAWMALFLAELKDADKGRVKKALDAFGKLDEKSKASEISSSLAFLKESTIKAVSEGRDVFTYLVLDGKKRKVKLVKADGGGATVKIDAGPGSKKRTVAWKDFDAKALAGCGMWCIDPKDAEGMLAVMKVYKSVR